MCSSYLNVDLESHAKAIDDFEDLHLLYRPGTNYICNVLCPYEVLFLLNIYRTNLQR